MHYIICKIKIHNNTYPFWINQTFLSVMFLKLYYKNSVFFKFKSYDILEKNDLSFKLNMLG